MSIVNISFLSKRRWPTLVSGAAALVLATGLLGQQSTNTFQVDILPPAGTVMVTQTVTMVFLSIRNLDLFTNVTVAMQVGKTRTPLLDDGNPPDQATADATYSGNLLVPAFPAATNFTVNFICNGSDVALTNDLGEPLPGAWVTTTNRVIYQALPRPPNDNFTNATKTVSGGGLYWGSNRAATIEPAEPLHGDDPDVANSVWWTWGPNVNGGVLIDSAGSSFSPVLAVYTGATLATLKLVAWSTNDVVNQLKANVVFDATAGVTYRIAVAGYATTDAGDVRLNILPGGRPDTQPPLVTVISPASEAVVTTNLVVLVGTAKDLPPDATGVSEVRVQLNDLSPVLATGTTSWTTTLDLLPGPNVVRVIARDLAGNPSRPFVLVIRYLDPVNDDFANATALTDVAGSVPALNTRATLEPGEPLHAGNEGGHSLWYSYRTTAPGSLRLSLRGADYDTLLAVYMGDAVTNLTLVAANDDATPGSGYSELAVRLDAGQAVFIAVDGYGGATGNADLQFTFTTQISYVSLTALPGLGGTIVPPSGLYVLGATQYVTALPERDFQFTGWDGSLTTLANPLTLVMTQNYTLTASFQVKSYTEGFEAGALGTNLTWSSGDAAPWFVQSSVVAAGVGAARSGAIGDGQKSWLVVEADVSDGAGAFDLRVSSEAGWDGLEFYLNGVRQRRWSGQVPWQRFMFALVAGRNRLEWRYVKDANYSAGLDAAFLDNLYLPLPDRSMAARLVLVKVPDNPAAVQLQVFGQPNRAYAIEASAGLRAWSAVFTNSSPGGSFVWFDAVGTNSAARFYRAVLQ